ncbi:MULTISPECIES: ABC transporter permease [unclassified Streptomyces]|uniref:ABC transporter permease n=1 Tax=unclassified Streptomyces TaxID=2593676 RepID=UPI000CD5445B|nr:MULTISPECIES: ABC transporter permease [unclassified Streptomyces]
MARTEDPDPGADPGTVTTVGTDTGRAAPSGAGHLASVLATARRVLRQLSHDPRTVAQLLAVPVLLLVLLYYVFDADRRAFSTVGASLLGIFPMITMFLVTSIATLRERSSGTLERLLTMPLGKGELIAGYALAFGGLATVQASIATATAVWLLDLDIAGSPWLLLVVAVLNALLGMALGLFVSAFAATEFQAVQFFPAVIVPQILLCGLFVPRDEMQPVLGAISDVLPLSYSVDGMTEVVTHAEVTGDYLRDVAVVAAVAAAVLAVGAATLRRRTA